jgi:hypothetical protein
MVARNRCQGKCIPQPRGSLFCFVRKRPPRHHCAVVLDPIAVGTNLKAIVTVETQTALRLEVPAQASLSIELDR